MVFRTVNCRPAVTVQPPQRCSSALHRRRITIMVPLPLLIIHHSQRGCHSTEAPLASSPSCPQIPPVSSGDFRKVIPPSRSVLIPHFHEHRVIIDMAHTGRGNKALHRPLFLFGKLRTYGGQVQECVRVMHIQRAKKSLCY